jgi:intracellular septation protein
MISSIHKLLSNPILIIVVFAGVYYSTGDFFYLTAAIMLLVTLQVVFEKIAKKKVSKVLFFSWLLLIPLGSLTLFLRDPLFLQWKFSIVHWLMGLILLITHFFKGPVLLRTLLSAVGPQLDTVPTPAWTKVTFFISIFTILIGFINLYFIYYASLDAWVNFKLYGVTLLNMVMISLSTFYLFKQSDSKLLEN